MQPEFTIALAGNPNSGKTTMFNALTGARQHVGNYPGVTVTKKEGVVNSQGKSVKIVDLPGTYSLTPYSEEELAARSFVVDEKPHAVIDIVDANTLERSLYLTVQFLELGVPVVVALNMMDEVRRRKIRLDSARLADLLNVPVIETVAREGEGKQEMLKEAIEFAQQNKGSELNPVRISYGEDIDKALDEMEQKILAARFMTDRLPARWIALKYIEGDEEVLARGRKADALSMELEATSHKLAKHVRTTLDTSPEALIADHRYGFISSILRQGVVKKDVTQERINFSDRLDKVLTNTFLGPLIMLGVIYGMFQLTFAVGEIPMGWVEEFFGWLNASVTAAMPDGLLRSLITSGIIDGVGGVLGFVPLILVMFFCLSFLEDFGYMARMAYMLDRVFKMFGLHGSSVMPFIISGGIPGGCAVPGVMAARTLRSPREKLATILTAPYLSCGAKVPVFVLLAAAFFPQYGADVLMLITLGGWAMALIVARVLRSTVIKGEPTPFVMELPPYRIPLFRGVLIHTWERGWQYIKKAGTVILAISILLWAAMTFPGLPENQAQQFEQQRVQISQTIDEVKAADANPEALANLEDKLAQVDNLEAEATLKNSAAGRAGTALESLSSLAGFDWRTNIALVGGFAAKEVIVSTLGTAFSLGEVDPEAADSLSARLAADPAFTVWSAISLIIFTLLYAPCFVTVVVIAKEAGWKWAAFSVGFNTVLAFSLATLVYQVGSSL
ncbi:ferrous iron transport protein B [Desulfobaculum bizertense]|uniref:Ferrous iron transport protein B n=1 Tax=Desulfobaculum bizertense DSM 18034 TaxID=1121442 RepID=A0A1T4VCP1_9BACT|nr:ferrous iron transport protein B [Desulfobaculum bizertense]SKA62697.1 ferrous iron transport protein B [Desulfobaculum bizertense DSM 18034]